MNATWCLEETLEKTVHQGMPMEDLDLMSRATLFASSKIVASNKWKNVATLYALCRVDDCGVETATRLDFRTGRLYLAQSIGEKCMRCMAPSDEPVSPEITFDQLVIDYPLSAQPID